MERSSEKTKDLFPALMLTVAMSQILSLVLTPVHVQADGRPRQKYGYSARALLALYYFIAGLPYNC